MFNVAIREERNIVQKKMGKKLKYKSLTLYYIMLSLHNT